MDQSRLEEIKIVTKCLPRSLIYFTYFFSQNHISLSLFWYLSYLRMLFYIPSHCNFHIWIPFFLFFVFFFFIFYKNRLSTGLCCKGSLRTFLPVSLWKGNHFFLIWLKKVPVSGRMLNSGILKRKESFDD